MKQQQIHNTLSNKIGDKYALNILVAEDNIFNQKLILTILKKIGFIPKLAKNGQEALELVQEQDFDLIFMDIQMPKMDGLEATRHIREMDIEQPKIIGVTANALSKDRIRCIDAGMDDYISKPFNLSELRERIEKIAKEKHSLPTKI